jgi:hypothetical protein
MRNAEGLAPGVFEDAQGNRMSGGQLTACVGGAVIAGTIAAMAEGAGNLGKCGKLSKAAKRGLNVASGVGGNIGEGQIIRMINKGESIAGLMDEAKVLTYTTGNEIAVVSLQSGGRALVSGGQGGINLTELGVKRILGHTHPYGGTGPVVPSALDFNALQQLGQRHSYILERGELIRFNAR